MRRVVDAAKNSEPPPIPRLALSVAHAVVSSGLSRSQLYKLMSDGSIPFIKVGARRLIPMAGLTEFISRGF